MQLNHFHLAAKNHQNFELTVKTTICWKKVKLKFVVFCFILINCKQLSQLGQANTPDPVALKQLAYFKGIVTGMSCCLY